MTLFYKNLRKLSKRIGSLQRAGTRSSAFQGQRLAQQRLGCVVQGQLVMDAAQCGQHLGTQIRLIGHLTLDLFHAARQQIPRTRDVIR